MKKFLLSLGLVAMMLNLTNCAQYEDVNTSVDVKGDFELYASISRTANDGLNTVWSANDKINVLHAEAGTTNYLNDTPYLANATQKENPFVCNDAATGYFLGTLHGGALDTTKSYDWYAFYPYNSYTTTPANDNGGRMYIGSRSDAAQTQEGNNSMAHIAGTNYPMAGYAKNVAANEAPALVFNHLSSLVAFEVVNQISEAITVSEIAFTAEEDIVGQYYINFADYNNIKFTKYNTYQSNTATLNVVNGTAIEAGASAKFYMAIKPFTATAGSDLTVKVTALVNGNELSYSKTINVAAATTFSAGKIKPIAVKYNVELPSAEEIIETIDFSKQGYANAYEVASYAGQDCNITFNKGTNNSNAPKYYTTGSAIRCYGGNTITIASENLKIKKVVFTFGSDDGTNTITANTGSFATDTWTGSANSVKFTIGGSTGNRRIQKIVITYGEPDPAIIASNPAAVAYNATSATISYELLVLTGTVTATTDAEWITAIDCNTEGKVVLTLTENTAYTARNANVTLSKEGAEDVVIKVTQNGKPKPSLTLTTAATTVEADATTTTIKYTYANLVGDVTATADVDWVTAVDCSTLGQVIVTFDANSGEDSRDAKITISSTDATSVTATITQKGTNTGYVASWKKESWSKFTSTSTSYESHTIAGDMGTWTCVGCSAYENVSTDVVKNTGFKYVTMSNSNNKAKITSPTFTNGIQGLKFKYYVNNTARKFKVTVYENGAAKSTTTITPTSKTTLLSYTLNVTTTGSTYITFEPTTTSNRVTIGEIEICY